MAWTFSHIFVQDAEPRAVAEAVKGISGDVSLRRELVGDSADLAALGFSPQIEGWVTITAANAWFSNLPDLASRVAAKLNVRTVSCELRGQFLQLRIAEYVGQTTKRVLQSPQVGWDDDKPLSKMPLYDDVAAKAYRTLTALKVPTSLLALGITPIIETAEPALLTLGDGLGLHASTLEIASRPFRSGNIQVGEVPVLPQELGRGSTIQVSEHRFVEGRPSAETVDRLIHLETQLELRLAARFPDQVVNLTTTYINGGYQHELDAALMSRHRHVPPNPRSSRPPWWRFWQHFGFKR